MQWNYRGGLKHRLLGFSNLLNYSWKNSKMSSSPMMVITAHSVILGLKLS